MHWRCYWLLCLWSVLLPPALAGGAVDLTRVQTELGITPRLELLREPRALLDLPGALRRPDWEIIRTDLLKEGYSGSAFWLRGQLRNDGSQPLTRWLSLGSARLEDVQFWLLEPSPAAADAASSAPSVVAHQTAGIRHALATRAVLSHLPVFAVTLAPGQTRQFVLRVRSDSLVDLQVTLWEPLAFRQEEGSELAIQAFLLGLALLLVVYALIQGVVWRDRGFVLMAAWIVTALAYLCSFQGYLYRFVIDQGSPWIVHAPATLACLTTLLSLRMTLALVDLRRLPPWPTLYNGSSAILAVLTLWTALGNYREVAPLTNAAIGLGYLLWLASMLHGWRRALEHARMLTLSFALAWLTMSVKLLEINRLLGEDVLPDGYFATLFQAGLLCMAGVIVVSRALALRRKHEQMQWAMLNMRVREQLKLQHTVDERTRALRQALDAADQANQAKIGLLTRISHDLRTPLTSILGFADMVQTGAGDHASHGRIIARSARHMLAMVDDLIDYARGDQSDAPQPAPVYIHALLQAIGQEGAALAQRRLNRFSLQIAPGLPGVLVVDARRLHRILGNLLDNAAKYTERGRITLRVEWQDGAAQGSKAPATGLLDITVSDTGCGIAAHHHARIFEPFERADADRGQPGIGMGLAIVRQWVTRMGGEITLDSAPQQGTRMRLRLPAEIGAERDLARHHAQEDTPQRAIIDGRGHLVLVVEDSAEIACLLVDQLSSLGFAVETCTDGQAAIERMGRSALPRADLVLTDYLMPAASGSEVLQAARRLWPGVPVLLLSATCSQTEAGQTDHAAAGFDACLLKPLHFLALQESIARLLGLERHDATSVVPTAPAGQTDDAAVTAPPPAARLAEARAMLELGAISDLLEWCDRLARDHPECAAFAARARQSLLQADLPALEQLYRESA